MHVNTKINPNQIEIIKAKVIHCWEIHDHQFLSLMICQYLLVGIDIRDRYIIFSNFPVHNTRLLLVCIGRLSWRSFQSYLLFPTLSQRNGAESFRSVNLFSLRTSVVVSYTLLHRVVHSPKIKMSYIYIFISKSPIF